MPENDRLNRQELITKVKMFINVSQKRVGSESISLAINSKWGSGKTCFISMWKKLIEDEVTSDKVIYYNAWENDDCDSVILPLLYNIISPLTIKGEEEYFDKILFFLKQLGMNTVKFGVTKLFDGAPAIIDIVKNSYEKTCDREDIKTVFSEFDDYYGKRGKLQETLRTLVPKNGKLWIFIDDLDRCNPVFAINTLECIKHFFNIDNIYFVFAIDFNHLVASARSVYGPNIDASSYMKKFFDSIYVLPAPRIEEYVNSKIDDIEDTEIKDILKPKEIIQLFEHFDFSLRDMDLTLTHLEFFAQSYKNELNKLSEDGLNLYFYFMCLKDKYNSLYLDIIHGNYSLEKNESTWINLDEKIFYNDTIRDLLKKISKRSAEKPSGDLFEKYHLITSFPEYYSFAEHMEYILC